jgi:hypothetical protein
MESWKTKFEFLMTNITKLSLGISNWDFYMLNELGQLSDKDLSRGYWFVTHRSFLIRILEVVIGIVAFVTLLYSAWQTVDWLTSRKAEEEALQTLVQSGTDIQALLARNTPQGLEVGTATALPLGGL